jgi:hypothetical protein
LAQKAIALSRISRLLFVACCLLFFAPQIYAQEVVDRMVATVMTSGAASPDLITQSDLVWQLALQPGTPIANPRPEDLDKALQLVINQRLILQEAKKMPSIEPTDEEIRAALADLTKRFASQEELQQRMNRVGLSSEELREIVRERVAIEKYLNFRFRDFIVITEPEIAAYYRDVFVPRFRQQSPGSIVPTLEEARDRIQTTLTNDKIESETDAFLDATRETAEIVILN